MTKYFANRYIPDEGPLGAPILLVGEAPGEQEYETGRPFVGIAGDKLVNCLERNGVSRSAVRLANLCHYRPYHNKFEDLLDTDVLATGLRELYAYIEQYKPVVIGALGAYPLKFLTGKAPIGKWRGSILPYINDPDIKVIPTFHPSFIAREPTAYPIFDTDLRRIVSDSEFREKRYTARNYYVNPTGVDLFNHVADLSKAPVLTADIESIKGTTTILCVGFASSKDHGVSITTETPEGTAAISSILNARNKKIFHFGTYDSTVLKLNGYHIEDTHTVVDGRPYYWDTFIGQHVLAPELPRSLEYLTSVITREPYYKTEGRANLPDDSKAWGKNTKREGLFIYNCKDVCVDFEIYESQRTELQSDPQLLATFEYEMQQLRVAHHIGLAGMYQDIERKKFLTEGLLKKWALKQYALNQLTGYDINVKSPKLASILYDKDKLGLPVRRKRDGKITTDEDAIVGLIAFCKDKINGLKRPDSIAEWTVRFTVLKTVLEIRGIRQLLSNYLLAGTSQDNRSRSLYKVGGTETGRYSASGWIDDTGYNHQTNPRDPFIIPEVDVLDFDEIKLQKMLAALIKEREEDVEREGDSSEAVA